MKANNLTISIPYKGCDKNCPYCVSKMTGYIECNENLIKRNAKKVLTIARNSGVTSVLLTGKGEPFLNYPMMDFFASIFKEFPLEIQTNGKHLFHDFSGVKNSDVIKDLYNLGFNTIAFSIDEAKTVGEYAKLFRELRYYGMNVRVTYNVSDIDDLAVNKSFEDFCEYFIDRNISQLSLRKLTIPEVRVKTKEASKTVDWITKYGKPDLYDRWISEFKKLPKREIRRLPFGAIVYDYEGLAITYFDYCIQEKNSDDDIRSLIFQEDGHLYTAWDSEASILF